MDSNRPEPSPSSDDRIDSLISEYFDRRESGEALTPEGFAGEHPDLAQRLLPYLEGLSILDRIRPPPTSRSAVPDRAGTPVGAEGLPTVGGYELLEEIGRGGMGVVYKALQISTKRVVALKLMLTGSLSSPAAQRRFEREVELAARLQHPNIVRVLESGRTAEQGRQYYAMDYVDGVPMGAYLAEREPDLHATLNILKSICEAVDCAHRHGVIHRDIKPANVLIDEEGIPHVLDFGLAKAVDQGGAEELLTPRFAMPGLVVGTLFYLSPEQAAGAAGEIDARTDVYALGTLLFEALTGKLPLDTTGRPFEVLRRIVEDPPLRPSALSSRADGEVEAIILKALEKTKALRYQSAQELGADIDRYLQGEPIQARRASGLYIVRKRLAKHRWAAAAVTVLVVLALGGLLTARRSRQRGVALARRAALVHQQTLESGDTVAALGGAQAIRARYPRLPEARLVWAQALCRSGRQHSAIRDLEGWLHNDPSRWPCRALLAEIYRETGHLPRAEELQAQVDRDAPDTGQAWYLRSLATLDVGRALRCTEEAVRRGPSHAPAWLRLAWLRFHTGDLDGASRAAVRLIELGEDHARWTTFKGQILVRQGRFEEAIEEYTRALASEPAGRSANLYRAHAYRRIHEYAKAVADYTVVVESESETTVVVWHLYQRATPLWILGRTEEALEDYRRVRLLRGRPFYSDARSYVILRETGRDDEAAATLEAALRDVREPWLRQVFRCLAGNLAPERLVADAVARNDPEKLCEAYYYAGETCLLAGDRAEARRWYALAVETGVEFDPDTAPAVPLNEYELAEWRLRSLPAPDAADGG